MPTPDAATGAIEARLRQAFPATAIWFPNTPLTPPLGQVWLRVHLVWGRSLVLSLRPVHTTQHLGVLFVDVYAPQSEGAGRQRRFGEQVRTLFGSQTFADVRCDAATGLVAHREETVNTGIWWVATVHVPLTIIEEVPS